MKNYLSRKEKIRITAIEIIFHEGIQALSVKNIAKHEGIAPSLLYRYYQGMEELLKDIISELGKFDSRIYQSIKSSNLNAKEKILKFIETLAEYYQNYPEITPILTSYEFFRSNPVLEEAFYGFLVKQRQYINDFIREGIKEKTFSRDTDSDIYTTIIMGAMKEGIFQWRITVQKGGMNEPSLKVSLLAITNKLLTGLEN